MHPGIRPHIRCRLLDLLTKPAAVLLEHAPLHGKLLQLLFPLLLFTFDLRLQASLFLLQFFHRTRHADSRIAPVRHIGKILCQKPGQLCSRHRPALRNVTGVLIRLPGDPA